MNRLYLIVPVTVSIIIYVLLSFILGQSGIVSYKQLEIQKINLIAHVDSIEQINDELNIEKTGLLQDPDVLRSYAKKIGYVSDGEILVKITGMEIKPDKPYNIGTYLNLKKIDYLSEKVIKLASVAIGVLLLVFSLFMYYSKKNRDSNNIKEILSYGDSKGF